MVRYFIFAIPFLIILGVALWHNFYKLALEPHLKTALSEPTMAILIVYGALFNMIIVGGNFNFPAVQLRFLFGQVSFLDGYNIRGVGWPELVEARRQVGLEERLLSLSPYYMMVPGRPIELEVDYSYRDWHVMVFGEAEEARTALQKEGLNYFLLDTERGFGHGGLPYSELFKPETLNSYFDLIWKKGNTYLLTWKNSGQSIGPIPAEVIAQWHVLLESSFPELYARIKLYYDQNHETIYPVYPDPSLPPLRGWQ